MQVPAPFDYERATSVEHALALLQATRPGGAPAGRRPLAAADDEAAPRRARVPHRHQRRSPTSSATSARTGGEIAHRRDDAPPRRCSSPTLLAARLPIFTDAERVIADPVVRNRGTIGGALCQADPAEDLSAVCAARRRAARDPRPRTASASSTMREFHRGPYETAVGDAEMLVEVRVPLRDGARQRLREGRAARGRLGGRRGRRRACGSTGGTIADAGIGLTAVGARRHAPTRAEAALRGAAAVGGGVRRGRRARRRGLRADRRPARPGRLQAPPGRAS